MTEILYRRVICTPTTNYNMPMNGPLQLLIVIMIIAKFQ